jgi:HAD superfamily 5'-nucleotidase-like hydrolase
MAKIEAIGFDMDHTLALYNSEPLDRLAFREAKKKLVAWGYPKEVARISYDPSFVIRGLVVDRRRGNILKMDLHRYVARATHGTEPLRAEERDRLYRPRLVRISDASYRPVDSPFSLPEIDLYAQLVDLADRRGEGPQIYRILYDDVRRAFDTSHADGSIKQVIAQNPGRFLLPDPALPETLDRFRRHGYRIFLLTNSESHYTALVLDHLLTAKPPARIHWSDYFDLVVVRANKPGYFLRRTQAEPIEDGFGLHGSRGKVWSGGGVRDLERRLGARGDRILYFGDHTYGDILKSKKVCQWRTAMIVHEMEREIGIVERLAIPARTLRRHLAARDRLETVADYLDRRVTGNGRARASVTPYEAQRLLPRVRSRIERLEGAIQKLETYCDHAQNATWGPTFRTERAPSYFASQVRAFACIYTGRVSNFLKYPVDRYFQAGSETLPHERL